MINQAITELYTDLVFIRVCKKYGKENHEELRSEVITILLEMPGERLTHIIENQYLLPYAYNVARIQGIDERSRFNKMFALSETINNLEISYDPIEEKTLILDIEQRHQQATKLLEKIESDSLEQSNQFFYEANIAKSKPKYGSIRALSRKVGIDYRGMQIALNKYIEYLKEWQKK